MEPRQMVSNSVKYICGICFAAYFHKLSDVGSSGRQQQHSITGFIAAHQFSVCLQMNVSVAIAQFVSVSCMCICCYPSIWVHFGCARDAHVVPKNSSHVSHSQHTVPKRIVLRCCSNFLLPSKSLNRCRKNCEYNWELWIELGVYLWILLFALYREIAVN